MIVLAPGLAIIRKAKPCVGGCAYPLRPIDYFDGDGPMNIANNVSRILPGTRVPWVVGAEEAGH